MAQVEIRHGDDAGFVYVGDTRLIFGPDGGERLLLEATRWGRPTGREWQEAVEALRQRFPQREVAYRP